ncbi:dual specificity protein phosphatase family protein [Pseudomonas sp. 32.2.56]|uniref:Protein-tyrosine-phosphatase n=1 Tax=Aquipseudomonas alcaligenes TaxID=43263 RepID=A0A5C7VXG1_AQUAC|nr:dual specificity protein phosphatase family protein [Pseudomonas sp. 32.2.56]MCR4511539.1 dual specificity protein phosphatase family protein [Pseudomonas sp. 32.2.56]TXI29283.1 MAG: protein-tyrosine-phosphatase [Pseudomonas alcaligenes]
MQGLLWFLRLCLAALVLVAALVALPVSMAWSAAPTIKSLAGETRPQSWAEPLDERLNLYRIQPNLYRSALPDNEAEPMLKELGVTTVINFYQRSDSAWLHDPKMRQIHLPFHTDRVDDTDVIAALRSIRQSQELGSVLIHCKHGQNRTGLIAALYRIVYQGWSKEQALAEMRGGGFGGEQRLDDAERYLQQVDIEQLKIALEGGTCSTSPLDLCAMKAWIVDMLKV